MTQAKLTPAQYAALGNRAADLLKLKRKRENKRFDTTWGDFTSEGLGAVLERMVNEAHVKAGMVFTAVPRRVKDTNRFEIYSLDERGGLVVYDGGEHSQATRDYMLSRTFEADLTAPQCQWLVQKYLNLPDAEGCTMRIGKRLAMPRHIGAKPD